MAAKSQGERQLTYVTTAEYDAATLPEVLRGAHGVQAPWGPEDIQQPGAERDHQLPQAIPSEYQAERMLPQVAPESDIYPHVPEKTEGSEDQPQPMSRRPWWRRRLFLLLALGIVILVGLVVGLAVGLTKGKGSDESPSETSGASPTQSATPTNTEDSAFGTPTTFSAAVTSQPSSCRGTVCPSMLATAQLAVDTRFFMFGRGDDKGIWYRFANQSRWDGDWDSLGGSFSSQPVAVSLGGGRVDVLATWTDGSIRAKTYQDSKWGSEWVNLGGKSISPPAVCSSGNNAMEVFGTTEDHLLMHRSYDGGTWKPALDRDWDTWGGYISASPAAVCSGPGRIDVVSYGGTASMLHDVGWMHYINGSWETWEGNSRPDNDKLGYRGDPALIALDNQSADFFGVGTDKQLYHVSWSSKSNYTATESLGGSFESTPHVFVTGSDRIDVLAVGTEDKLMHKARIGGTWSTDWEDLGGYFNSVPLVTSSEGDWIAVFGLGPDGRVIHGNWSSTDSFVWGQGAWFDDGGDLSSTWFRAGPAR